MTHGGGSWRSGSAATGLPWSRLPRGFLHLRALRSRTPLLQRPMPRASPPPAAAVRQQTPPTEPRRTARSSRPAAGVPVPPSSSAIARDGSRFPFDHFPGIIRLWMGRCGKASSGVAVLAGNPARVVAALPDLRPHRTLHRSISTHSTTKVSHRMISPETRAQIRRYFYAEHWKIGTIASELGVHPDAVRNAIESERFKKLQAAGSIRRRSLHRVHSPHSRSTSAPARHAHLPDDSRPRLQRQRGAVAAYRCPLASAEPRTVPATPNVSRRASASRLGALWARDGGPRQASLVLLRDDAVVFASFVSGVLLRSNHGELPARPRACV